MEVLSSPGSLVSKNFKFLGHQRQERGNQMEAAGLAHRAFRTPANHTASHSAAQGKVIRGPADPQLLGFQARTQRPPILPRITTIEAGGRSYSVSFSAVRLV